MSKQKTVQKKQNTHKGPPPKTHHESQRSSPFGLFMLFFAYFVVCLLIASLIYMFSGQRISTLMAWLLPLIAAAVLTFLHEYLHWPKPNL